jgi:septal ring factor EnvC (AmiA/AmiB activator)
VQLKRKFVGIKQVHLNLCLALALSSAAGTLAVHAALDQYTYNNLLKARDGLMDQKEQIRISEDQTSQQIHALQTKLNRLEQYGSETDQALRDIDSALSKMSN